MGKIVVTREVSPEEQRRRLREETPSLLEELLSLIRGLRVEAEKDLQNASPELREKYRPTDFDRLEGLLLDMQTDVTREDTPLETLKQNYLILQNTVARVLTFLAEKENDYRIVTDPETGESKLMEFKSQTPPSGGALAELKKLSDLKVSRIEFPRDLMKTQTHSVGDTLQYIKDPKKKEHIQRLQKDGKLLAGTLEGLSGGSAYLKSFTIALAQTLNEQSKYYKTEGDLSGLPLSYIHEIFGDGVEVVESYQPIPVMKKGQLLQENRKLPFVLISYEAIAKKMKGEGKKVGGQDIKFVEDYINSLSGKQYLFCIGEDSVLGVPFLTKSLIIYRGTTGKEVGCLVSLSPQFSKSIGGYTSLRGDTLQKIGGGRQKDITMNLLDLLLYVRGTNKEENTWKKVKEELLSQIGTSKRYIRQKGELERDFREAVQKVKDSGLILGYREDSGVKGKVSVFTFNPDYLKHTENKETPEEQ